MREKEGKPRESRSWSDSATSQGEPGATGRWGRQGRGRPLGPRAGKGSEDREQRLPPWGADPVLSPLTPLPCPQVPLSAAQVTGPDSSARQAWHPHGKRLPSPGKEAPAGDGPSELSTRLYSICNSPLQPRGETAEPAACPGWLGRDGETLVFMGPRSTAVQLPAQAPQPVTSPVLLLRKAFCIL